MLRGVPFTATTEEIHTFFKGYSIIGESVKFGVNSVNRRTGYVAALFRTESECAKALNEKQGKNIRHRYIELFLHDFAYHQAFEETQIAGTYVSLNTYITEENKDRIVILTGLPFQSGKDEIVEFMGPFKPTKHDVVIGMKNGNSTGKALVFLKDKADVKEAEQMLDKKYIDTRYIRVRPVYKVKDL